MSTQDEILNRKKRLDKTGLGVMGNNLPSSKQLQEKVTANPVNTQTQSQPKAQEQPKPIKQADMTLVSPSDDPNNPSARMQSDINNIDVTGKGIYGKSQFPQVPTPQEVQKQVTENPVVPDAVKANNTGTMDYAAIMKMLDTQHADEQKRIEREKRKNRIAAIGNGLSALANLYYTTKGAPNSHTPELSARMKAKYDELEKEQRTNSNAYLNSYLTILGKQRADELAKDRIKATTDYNKARLDYQAQKDAEDRALKETIFKGNQEIQKEKLDETKRSHQENEAIQRQRAATYAQKRGGSGRSGNKTVYWLYDNNNQIHYYTNKSQWESDSYRFANEGGIPTTKDVQTTTTKKGLVGDETNTRTNQVTMKPTEVAAKVNAKNMPRGGKGATTGKGKGGFSIHNNTTGQESNKSNFSIHK